MEIFEYTVKVSCEYSETLLLKGDLVYISEPYNFGKRRLYNADRKLICFQELEMNHFTYKQNP